MYVTNSNRLPYKLQAKYIFYVKKCDVLLLCPVEMFFLVFYVAM